MIESRWSACLVLSLAAHVATFQALQLRRPVQTSGGPRSPIDVVLLRAAAETTDHPAARLATITRADAPRPDKATKATAEAPSAAPTVAPGIDGREPAPDALPAPAPLPLRPPTDAHPGQFQYQQQAMLAQQRAAAAAAVSAELGSALAQLQARLSIAINCAQNAGGDMACEPDPGDTARPALTEFLAVAAAAHRLGLLGDQASFDAQAPGIRLDWQK